MTLCRDSQLASTFSNTRYCTASSWIEMLPLTLGILGQIPQRILFVLNSKLLKLLFPPPFSYWLHLNFWRMTRKTGKFNWEGMYQSYKNGSLWKLLIPSFTTWKSDSHRQSILLFIQNLQKPLLQRELLLLLLSWYKSFSSLTDDKGNLTRLTLPPAQVLQSFVKRTSLLVLNGLF